MKNEPTQITIPLTDEELLLVGQAMGKIGKTDIGDYARNTLVVLAKMVIDEAKKPKNTPKEANTEKITQNPCQNS